MRIRTVMALAALAVVAACAKPPLDEQQKTALADSIEQYVAGPFLAAYNSGNTDSILATYAPGTGVQSVENGTIYANHEAMAAALRAASGTPQAKLHFTLAAPQVTVLSREAAVYTTMVSGTGRDSAGAETTMRLAWTGVFVRTAAGWRIQAEHSSMAPAPAPAPAAKPSRRGR